MSISPSARIKSPSRKPKSAGRTIRAGAERGVGVITGKIVGVGVNIGVDIGVIEGVTLTLSKVRVKSESGSSLVKLSVFSILTGIKIIFSKPSVKLKY